MHYPTHLLGSASRSSGSECWEGGRSITRGSLVGVCVDVGVGTDKLMPVKVTGKEAGAQLSCDQSELSHWLGLQQRAWPRLRNRCILQELTVGSCQLTAFLIAEWQVLSGTEICLAHLPSYHREFQWLAQDHTAIRGQDWKWTLSLDTVFIYATYQGPRHSSVSLLFIYWIFKNGKEFFFYLEKMRTEAIQFSPLFFSHI